MSGDFGKRMLIAKACGWESKPIGVNSFGLDPKILTWTDPDRQRENDGYEPPDFSSDLNAMADAEKLLKDEEVGAYVGILVDIVERDNPDMPVSEFATAGQRAEAFCKVKGLQ